MKNIIKAIKWIITVGVDSFLSSVVVGVLLIFVTVIGVGGVKLLLLLPHDWAIYKAMLWIINKTQNNLLVYFMAAGILVGLVTILVLIIKIKKMKEIVEK